MFQFLSILTQKIVHFNTTLVVALDVNKLPLHLSPDHSPSCSTYFHTVSFFILFEI